jgi:2,4-dichlorophenol 6-monooxygenase
VARTRVPVLIVGGGAAGLTTSILLSRLGVETLLVERHATTSMLPKAHILNQRTMEVFREAGLAAAVYGQGAPLDAMSRTVWYTSLAGPTPLHGREVGRIDSWGGGAQTAAYDAASPCRLTNLPQHWLEPLMLEHAQRSSSAELLFRHELVGVEQDTDGVTATVRALDTGEEFVVTADHLVAADGGRTVGRLVGLEFEGRRSLVNMVSTHFSADLSASLPDPGAAIYRFVNPDGPGLVHRGTLVQMGGGGWGRDCREWIFSFSVRPDDPTDFAADDIIANLRTMLGLPDLEVTVHRVSPWKVEGVAAAKYRIGRISFVGDAAHRHPPAGGLGLNTAVQDAHNLAWKLAAVVRGRAGEGLLDSYEAERRPIGVANAEHALQSFFQNQEVDRALGFEPTTTPEESWAVLATYFSDSAESAVLHERVEAAIRSKRYAYQAHGQELGFAYAEGALVPDPSPAPEHPGDPVTDYVPSTRSGHRVPHAWLHAGGEPISTIDLPRGEYFVLLTGPGGAAAWREAGARARAEFPAVPFAVVVVGPGGDLEDDGTWARLREVEEKGAVLVRPDGHVAWRSHSGPSDPGVLADVLGSVLFRTPVTAGQDG